MYASFDVVKGKSVDTESSYTSALDRCKAIKEWALAPGLELDMSNLDEVNQHLAQIRTLRSEIVEVKLTSTQRSYLKEVINQTESRLMTIHSVLTGKLGGAPTRRHCVRAEKIYSRRRRRELEEAGAR